ncbi:hypothetical protein O0L34_g13167 [Tuta absoluta]|nr:hypothetical protein O0L34_g13167 [Tuta absoluta]
MSIFYILVALMLHQSSTLTISAQDASQLKEMYKEKPECRKFQCTSISDPICVRMKYVTSALEASTVYVIMVNRCEIKYANCHEIAEAKEVPMKYCRHEDFITNEKRKKKPVHVEPLADPIAKPLPIKVRRRRAVDSEDERVKFERKKIDKEKKIQELYYLNDAKAQIMAKKHKKMKKNYENLNDRKDTIMKKEYQY